MQILKPCPCGKTPQTLHIADNGSKWAYVSGDCCNAWNIEFRTQYNGIETDECMALAVEAWNEAERICINPKCKWIGKETDCMDYKHPIGARLCPECYEVTEEIHIKS